LEKNKPLETNKGESFEPPETFALLKPLGRFSDPLPTGQVWVEFIFY